MDSLSLAVRLPVCPPGSCGFSEAGLVQMFGSIITLTWVQLRRGKKCCFKMFYECNAHYYLQLSHCVRDEFRYF